MESTRELLEKLGSNEKETFGFKSHKCPPPVKVSRIWIRFINNGS